jgi:thiamine-monophosphate kinase
VSEQQGGELALIEWIRTHVSSSGSVPIGIGDDAALVRNASGSDTLVTTDLLMDGVHFQLSSTEPQLIGRKALAVNLSDIAAMAGVPRAAFVSLALPKSGGRTLAEAVHTGLQTLAHESGVVIAGGDTNTWNGPLVLNVTLLAEPAGDGPVLRSGARVGDLVLITGALGGSLAGRHLRFIPRVREALSLHATVDLHAMIDLSDGLATDLGHVLQASGVGAVIDAAALPIHDDVDPHLQPEQRIEHALGDGEDFELLFTVNAEDARRLLSASPIEAPLSVIGEITTGREFLLRHGDGQTAPVRHLGWEHGFNC